MILARSAIAATARRLRRRLTIGRPETHGSTQNRTLRLSVDDFGWRGVIVDAEGRPIGEAIGEVSGPSTRPALTRLEAHLRQARETLVAMPSTEFDAINLLIDDPDIPVTDNGGARFLQNSPDSIREFGGGLLATGSTTYGSTTFGAGETRELERQAYAFMDAERAKRLLAALEEFGVKVTTVTPAAAHMLDLAAANETQPYCGLSLAGGHSTFVVSNSDLGIIVHRTLPVGVGTLIAAVARAQQIPFEQALEGMRRRDRFAAVPAEAPDDNTNSMLGSSVHAQSLGPLLRSLIGELRETLAFFAVHRVGGAPDRLRVFGDCAGIRGMTDWLATHIGLPVEVVPTSIAEAFLQRPAAAPINLLMGSRESLITIGKIRYHFSGSRFWPEEKVVRGGDVWIRRGADRRRQQGVRLPERRTTRRRTEDGPPLGGMLNGRVSREHGYAVALAVMFVATAWVGSDYLYAPSLEKLDRSVAAYARSLEQNAALRETVRDGLRANTAPVADVDFVWTEKLLAAARHIEPGMSLREIRLTTTETREKKQAAIAKTLILQGVVQVGDGSYLRRISGYLERLSADPVFMHGFQRIAFDRAAPDAEAENEGTVGFVILAWTSDAALQGRGDREDGTFQGLLETGKRKVQAIQAISDSLK